MTGIVVVSSDDATDPTGAMELVGGARRLADAAHGSVIAVIPRLRPHERGAQLIAHGADVVINVEHPWLAEYESDCMLPVLEQICERHLPRLVLMEADSHGHDLAARLAFRRGGSFVNNSTGVGIIQEEINVIKPIHGGRATVTLVPRNFPIVVSVRRTSFQPGVPDGTRTGEVQTFEPRFDHDPRKVRLVERASDDSRNRVNLETARVVVSGGRGMKGPEHFARLEALARLLHGAVGASRAATDAGWVSAAQQVGQTGRTVRPDLYLAFGISGAVQHVVGMSSSKVIAAVNTDPEAPIFRVADLGVVGDCATFLPALISEIERIQASEPLSPPKTPSVTK